MTGTGTNNFFNSGIWNTSGASTFAGSSGMTNGGTINVFGPTGFSGLTSLTSSGTLNLAAGNAIGTLTIPGTLAFQSGALYVVGLQSIGSSKIDAGGTATLAGAVQAVLLPGTFPQQTATILTSAGLGGTTFSGFSPPAGFGGTLSYTPTDVIVHLTAMLGAGGGLNTNQQNVATATQQFLQRRRHAAGGVRAGLQPQRQQSCECA